ncbi:MAG: MFS transporter [Burkholderiaceae bacterium]|jgi:MFS family permease|nr:MFS transporter [Burkholderiaceae bacterium]MEB2319789.1 MFS transporter [Pseudomonadota bacterium]
MTADLRSAPIDESSWRHPGWRVVAAMFVLATGSFGVSFYGLAVYLVALNEHYGWPIARIASLYTLYHLVGAGLLVFIGSVISRLGGRGVMVAGLCAMAAAIAGMSVIDAFWQLAACLFLLAIGWSCLSTAAITAVLAPWFQKRRSLAVGLALNGASFAGLIMVPLMVWIIERHGVERGLPMLAVGLLAVLVPVVWFALRRQPPVAASADTGTQERHSLAQIARSPRFWGVAAPFALPLVGQVGFLTHQLALLEPRLGVQAAAWAIGVTTGAGVIGRTAFGALADRFDPRRMTGVMFIVQASCLLLLAAQPGPVWLYVACGVYGLGLGNMITMPGVIAYQELPPRDVARAIGLVYGTLQVCYSFGPAILGLIRDATGSYSPALWFSAGMITIGAVLLQVTRPRGAS